MRRLGRWLSAKGRRVEYTREPDGTRLGLAVRRLFERPGVRPEPLVEVFLFMAASHGRTVAAARSWRAAAPGAPSAPPARAARAGQTSARATRPGRVRGLYGRARA